MTRAAIWLGTASALVLAATSPVYADGTQAGTTITNTAQVNYQVGGVAQSQLTASNSVLVDRKINLTVSEVGTATTQVSPGQPSAVTTFTVTNTSNAILDFALGAAQQTGGSGAHANTDNFDASNVRTYVDTNGNGSFDAGDTQAGYLDELGIDASATVFVVADIPLGRATGDVAAVTLTATGRDGGTAGSQGAALTQTSGANTNSIDTVFADGSGATDGSHDAAFSAKDDYTVSAAALTLSKSSRVISDPINSTTNPKLIPGAVVEYCIAVANAAGGAGVSNVVISDTVPTATTYVSAFGILLNGTVTGTTCNTDGTAGGNFAAGAVSGTIASIAAGDARTLVFRVTIN